MQVFLTYKAGLLIQTGFYKFFERFAVVSFQCGWVVLWDEEQDLHRMELRVGGLSFSQLYGRYA